MQDEIIFTYVINLNFDIKRDSEITAFFFITMVLVLRKNFRVFVFTENINDR